MSEDIDYRCKVCGMTVPRNNAPLKMDTCLCGAVMVDRGWSGTRVLWPAGEKEDFVEEIRKEKAI